MGKTTERQTMKTKPKHDLRFYIDRAVKDFKTLVIYFNVTRPQYEEQFKDNGKFSTQKLMGVMRFLNGGWKKSNDIRKYNRLSAVYNYTFGIPNELVRKTLGEYVDENGKHHRIPVTPIVKWLQKGGWLGDTTDAGKGFAKDKESGKWKTVCQWRKKYPLANVKYWFRLLSDENYSDINGFPNASPRIKKIIMDWHNKWGKKTPSAPTKPTEEKSELKEKIVGAYEQKMERYGKVKYYKNALNELSAMSEGMVNELHQTYLKLVKRGLEQGFNNNQLWKCVIPSISTKFVLSDELTSMFNLITNIICREYEATKKTDGATEAGWMSCSDDARTIAAD